MSDRPRFLAASLPDGGGEVVLGAEAARHARVLRLDAGAAVALFDGRGSEAEARITAIDAEKVRCLAGPPIREHEPRGPRVVLIQALPKGKKLDAIVRMTTELGVAEIRLATSARAVVRPAEDRRGARIARLARIAEEAARQSRRATVPGVSGPSALLDCAADAPAAAAKLVLFEGASAKLAIPEGTVEAWLVIGPEGGLEDAEVTALEALGFAPVSLGPSILRVETAAPIAVFAALDRMRGRP